MKSLCGIETISYMKISYASFHMLHISYASYAENFIFARAAKHVG
jgi:hypothetical protein